MRAVIQPCARKTALASALAMLAAVPATLAAPGDALAPPFTVATIGFDNPGVAVRHDAAGNFLVLYSAASGSLAGQLFSAAGTPRAAPFVIAPAYVYNAAAAMDPAGDFAVTWTVGKNDGTHLYAQHYSAAGAALGAPVNVVTEPALYSSSVAMDANGDFVVAWAQNLEFIIPDGLGGGYGAVGLGSSSVRAQRYARDGSLQGKQLTADLSLTNPVPLTGAFDPPDPVVAMDAAGDFVIAWQDSSVVNRPAVYVRRFAAGGGAPGLIARVNPLGQISAYYPTVAMDDDGDYVVNWATRHVLSKSLLSSSSSGYDLYTQRYSKTGQASGSATLVSQEPSDVQSPTALAMDAAGDYALAWVGSPNGCCQPTDLRLQAFSAAGAAIGGNKVIGTGPVAIWAPALSISGGNLVLSWASNSGSGTLQAQLLGGP